MVTPILCEGDEVLISVADHHANIVPWHLLGGRVGSKTVAAPVDADGSFNMKQFKAHITPRTKLFQSRMSLMSWAQSSDC